MKLKSEERELEKMLTEYGNKQFECGVCDVQSGPLDEYKKIAKEAKQLRAKIIEWWRGS
jgi:hypothetical protein